MKSGKKIRLAALREIFAPLREPLLPSLRKYPIPSFGGASPKTYSRKLCKKSEIEHMKVASIDELKKELSTMPPKKILDLTLRLARFRKENKELLTYLLFEAGDEAGYVQSLQLEIDELLSEIPASRTSVIKKHLRKISRLITRQSKYIGSKVASVELVLHFAESMHKGDFSASAPVIFVQQLNKVRKLISFVDEDLQYDYERRLAMLETSGEKKKWWKLK